MDSLSPADWVVIAILAVAFFSGLAQGFFRSVCGLAGLILGLAVASWNYHALADIFSSVIPEPTVDEVVAFLVLTIAVVLVCGAFGHLLARSFKLIGLGWLDSMAGGAFGLIQGAVIISIVIFVLVGFAPHQTHWLADAYLPRQFFATAKLSTHLTPSEIGVRIRDGIEGLERQVPSWIH